MIRLVSKWTKMQVSSKTDSQLSGQPYIPRRDLERLSKCLRKLLKCYQNSNHFQQGLWIASSKKVCLTTGLRQLLAQFLVPLFSLSSFLLFWLLISNLNFLNIPDCFIYKVGEIISSPNERIRLEKHNYLFGVFQSLWLTNQNSALLWSLRG